MFITLTINNCDFILLRCDFQWHDLACFARISARKPRNPRSWQNLKKSKLLGRSSRLFKTIQDLGEKTKTPSTRNSHESKQDQHNFEICISKRSSEKWQFHPERELGRQLIDMFQMMDISSVVLV